MKGPGIASVLLFSTLASSGWASLAASPQAVPDVETLLARVADRIVAGYQRAQRVICLERSVVQPIASNLSWDGLARTVESELRVVFDAGGNGTLPRPTMVREVRRINGRAPHERDRKNRQGCTDPSPVSPEPLAFLLPAARQDYRFAPAGQGRINGRAATMIDYASTNRTSRPELVEDDRGHDDCFDWKGALATAGRVWVDAETHDVLRVDRRVLGPVDVRVSWTLQQRYGFRSAVVIDRDEVSMRYRPVTFRDPDEVILLPESIQSVTVMRGGLQSVQRSETYSDYRRFLGAGRIVGLP